MFEPDASAPGLWRAASLAPGAHALVIGISDYPYLAGGSAPLGEHAPDSGGLGQLEVSALSAARFFAWLRDTSHVAGAPVGSCRLVLAPRSAEEKQRVDAITGGHYAIADYEAIRTALIGWSGDLSLAGRSAGPNVALFFFSGHGVEVAATPAILARDVLDQKAPDGGGNKALAVDPMTIAIRTYNIDRGLFFIDACRDSPVVARLLNVVGDQPIRPSNTPLRRVDAMIRLHSTASGLRAYQVATDPGTIFTQAILDGLEGPPPSYLPYDTSNVPWQLLFGALEGHTKRKVTELLKGHSPLALQPVEPYGYPYNASMLVATKEGPQPDFEPYLARVMGLVAGIAVPMPAAAPAAAIEDGSARIMGNAQTIRTEVIDAARSESLALAYGDFREFRDFRVMHEVFGSESFTLPWLDSVQLLDARTGELAEPDAARIVAAHREQVGDRFAAWVDFTIRPGLGEAIWIGAGNRRTGSNAAVVIPRDSVSLLPVRLDIAFEQSGMLWDVVSLSARLADPKGVDDISSAYHMLWEAQRAEAFADLASAARIVAAAPLDHFVAESPVAAALAMNLLLRADALDPLGGWPRLLAERFQDLADGPVLWTELLLRKGRDDLAEPLDAFLALAGRGPPLLLNSLRLAVRQALGWRSLLEAGRIQGSRRGQLEQVLEEVERAGRFLVSGGIFARFVGTAATVSPEHVLGAGRRLRRAAAAAA